MILAMVGTLKLEKVFDEKHELEILKGVGYGIIEDCGGVGGLEHIVELCNSRSGREYDEFVAWPGLVEFDIKHFDCSSMNNSLLEIVTLIRHAYETPSEY